MQLLCVTYVSGDNTCGCTVGMRSTLDGKHCFLPASPSRRRESLCCRPRSNRSCRTIWNNTFSCIRTGERNEYCMIQKNHSKWFIDNSYQNYQSQQKPTKTWLKPHQTRFLQIRRFHSPNKHAYPFQYKIFNLLHLLYDHQLYTNP